MRHDYKYNPKNFDQPVYKCINYSTKGLIEFEIAVPIS